MSDPRPPSRTKRHRKTLVERMDEVLAERGPLHISDLEAALYPDARSHRYSVNGGPPGCRMAVSAAITRGRFSTEYLGGSYSNRIVRPRK